MTVNDNADIERSLGRLEGKIDQILIGMTQHEARDEARFQNMELRLGSLERKVWYASGIAAVVVLILSKITFNSWSAIY